jgi:hypothetical protein
MSPSMRTPRPTAMCSSRRSSGSTRSRNLKTTAGNWQAFVKPGSKGRSIRKQFRYWNLGHPQTANANPAWDSPGILVQRVAYSEKSVQPFPQATVGGRGLPRHGHARARSHQFPLASRLAPAIIRCSCLPLPARTFRIERSSFVRER